MKKKEGKIEEREEVEKDKRMEETEEG